LDLSNDLTSSGAVNVTTKSGTDAAHEAFGLFRNNSLGSVALPSPVSANTVKQIPSPYQRNQEGGNIGGPVTKDKLFLFLDGERTLQHLAAPVPEESPVGDFSGSFQAPFKEYELMGRLDYSLTQRARLFSRFNYFQKSAYATSFPSSYDVYDNKDHTRNEALGLDFNTSSVTHSIRFSYLKFQNQMADATRGTSLPFANYPVSITILKLRLRTEFACAAKHTTKRPPLKYDGSKASGKHRSLFSVNTSNLGWFKILKSL
jgi:hypothetical protein